MASDKIPWRIYLRVAAIGVFLWLFTFSLFQDRWYVTSFTALMIAVLLSIELARNTQKHKRELKALLEAIRQKAYNDDGLPISEKGSYRETFSLILSEMKNARIEKEAHYQYLNHIVSHVQIALLCFDENGRIDLFNESAASLLGIGKPDNIRQLRRVDGALERVFMLVKESGKESMRIHLQDEVVPLVFYASTFRMLDHFYCLVSIHNIKAELDAQEMESWKKLIRVLTHEIMNSVTPVKSLTRALRNNLEKEDEAESAELNATGRGEVIEALKAIEGRSSGLLRFVDLYRSITRLPEPELSLFKAVDIVRNVVALLKPDFQKDGIKINSSHDGSEAMIHADYDMIQQVLINLLLNAQEAVKDKENPLVSILSGKQNGRTFIELSDNGCGISVEDADQIFIPFFTTRKNGSGIGLSLSRQIMQLHKAHISFESREDEGSRFWLRF